MVRENSVCIIHVIFNAATDGDKPVKRRVKYESCLIDSLCSKDYLKGQSGKSFIKWLKCIDRISLLRQHR